MDLVKLIILIFLLTSLVLGISSQETDLKAIDNSFNSGLDVVNNINLNQNTSTVKEVDTILIISEKYIQFIGYFIIEIGRAGAHFGHDNPQYFEPEFIIKIMKLIIILIIVSLLIKPLFYLGIFVIMLIIWIKDKLIERRKKRNAING